MLHQDSSRPLYEQLKQTLLRDMMSDVYRHGERLPSELNLAEKYGISRITVRRALAELSEEGYLSSQQGRGTFVNYTKSIRQLKSFGGFSESVHDSTIQRNSKVLSKEIIPAEGELPAFLDVEEGTPLIKLHRLKSENGKPYLIDTAFFIESMYPGMFDLLKDDVSTFNLMKNRYKIEFAKAKKALSVIKAGADEAELLHCVPGDPLFSMNTIIYNGAGKPVYCSHYLVLGERYIYTLTVTSETVDM
jgi:DNA-binding GntR family transcriptional regulator